MLKFLKDCSDKNGKIDTLDWLVIGQYFAKN